MATTTHGFKSLFTLFVVGLTVIHFASIPEYLSAQSQGTAANARIASSDQAGYSRVVLGPVSPSAPLLTPQVSGSGAGLTIIPTFNSTGATSIDAATQTVINNAIAFYQNTFTNNITVNIEFHNMNTGLGQSVFFVFSLSYPSYRTALAANATSADDATALANTPSGSTNPVTGSSNIVVKSPNGRALGFNTPEQSFNFGGSPCPTFTGSGCIGLNVTLANSHGDLMAVVEHEINEVLGLGSGLQGTTIPADPWTEDLFRWASPGVRSFAANTSTTNPCTSTPSSFFTIDGGTTNLNQFNNCNNGGDYGDWITHTPSQVQDAFTNFSGSPSLNVTSPEVRALDVIGYTIVVSKHRRGQLISQ
jgi:hypothetical protein